MSECEGSRNDGRDMETGSLSVVAVMSGRLKRGSERVASVGEGRSGLDACPSSRIS